MSIRVSDESRVCLYDSVNGWAFGPVFESVEHAEDFQRWLAERFGFEDLDGIDPLALSPQGWKARYEEWFDDRVDGESGELIG